MVEYGQATIVVKPTGEAVEGVPVVFQEADGEVVGEVMTGEDGLAAMDVHRDAMATILLYEDLYTIGGVQPEEMVELSSWAGLEGAVVGQVRVSADPVGGAVEYWIALGCEALRGGSVISPAAPVDLRDTCLEDDGTFDVVAVALDEARVMKAFAYATDVVPDADGMTDVTVQWYTDLPTIDVSYDGQRTDLVELYGELDPRRKGFGYAGDDERTNGATVSLQHLEAFADAVNLRAVLSWGGVDGGDAAAIIYRRDNPIPDSFVITDEDLLPQVTSATLDFADPGRPVARWSGDTRSADGVRIQFVYEGGDVSGSQAWFVCVPPGPSEFRFPVLPESLTAYGPTAETTPGADTNFMGSFESDVIEGYAAFREMHCLDFWRTIPQAEPEFTERHSETRFHW